MSTPTDPHGAPVVESPQDLVDYFATGEKPPAEFRIGTEHEKFAFYTDTLERIPYDGTHGRTGVRDLLLACQSHGWQPYNENGNPIAMRCPQSGATVSLEPGGQIELSGAPLESVHATCKEAHDHLRMMKTICAQLGLGMLGLGADPRTALDDIPWMPKARYAIMRKHMPTMGRMGLEMMVRSCTIQVNLDYTSEPDMIRKMRVALALQPLAMALFANAPIIEGQKTGFLSIRNHYWTDVDPLRGGMIPFVFDADFGYERWARYVMETPMYFIHDQRGFHDVQGQSFQSFLDRKLPGFEHHVPTIKDWEDHLSTVFPEVRLKKFLEMRGADGGSWDMICALPALWVGLLYDHDTLLEVAEMIQPWAPPDILEARAQVARQGLQTPLAGQTLQRWAVRVLNLAQQGLKRRARLNAQGADESVFLDRLLEIASTGTTQAELLLKAFEGRWQGDPDCMFRELAF